MKKDLSDDELYALITRLERFAKLSDSKFKIPGTNIPIGLDAIIGFIPIVGEIFGAIMSLYLLHEARKIGAPSSLKFKMLLNILMDFLIGLIPIIGDLGDIGFRSNIRNMKLLVLHIQERRNEQQGAQRKKIKLNYWLIGAVSICLITALIVMAIL